jgi:tetratricopeptide (TPR) repeat protein
MSGGYLEALRLSCAHGCATGLLAGLLISSGGVSSLLAADPAEQPAGAGAAVDGGGAATNEKSIVIQTGNASTPPPDIEVATDNVGDALEPIANASEYAPDLAEKAPTPAETPATPTPAAPEERASQDPGGASDLAPVTGDLPQAPTAEEVYIEELAEDEPEDAEPASLEPATFSGVTPGVTTRGEVLSQWGDPLESQVGGKTLTYEQENFPSIVVTFNGDQVESIRVQLYEPAKPQSLIARLGLSAYRPAVIADELGAPVRTLFPERGVTLSHRPRVGAAMATDGNSPVKLSDDDGVYEIVVRPIEAGPFLLRAERCADSEYEHKTADLKYTISFDGKNARAHWMLSQVKLNAFHAAEAERLAAQAVQLDSENDEFHLQWAKCLTQLARYDEALEQTRWVLERKTCLPAVRADALEQMGVLASLGSKEVQQRAVPLHNKAIEIADGLAKSDAPAERAAANRVLLAAHLAIAERIAVGDWQKKDETVEQWISRGSALAEQMISSHETDISVRLQVALSALAAGGRLSPPINPQPWIAEAEGVAAELEPKLSDVMARDVINWQLGLAYYYAAEIQHRRGEPDLAIKYGEQADATLTPLADKRAELPDTQYVLGRLYFQVGAVYAVHKQDHDQACQWYDRAVDLLVKDVPLTPLANPGHHGDALVSMGVSYWEVGQRERAYELTQAGVQCAQHGVDEGLLSAETLNVPQGNLNAMARALGKLPADEEVSDGGPSQMARSQSGSGRRMAGSRASSRMAQRRSGGEVTRR